MRTSEAINEVAAALAKAQGMMRPAIKDSMNPAFRSKYADLAAVWEAWHEVGPVNGIATVQDVTTEERGVAVITRLLHTSGQWLEFGPLTVPLAKFDAHGVGSATSYAKRYGLSAAVGVVAEEDDDGNQAAAGAPKKTAWRPGQVTDEQRRESAERAPYAQREIDKATGEVLDTRTPAERNPEWVPDSFKALMARRAKLPPDVQVHIPTDEDMHAIPPPELLDALPGYVDAIANAVKRRKLSPETQAELKALFLGNPRAQLSGAKHNPYFVYALFKHMRTDEP